MTGLEETLRDTGPLILISAAVAVGFLLIVAAFYKTRADSHRARRIQRVQDAPRLESGGKVLSVKRSTADSGFRLFDAAIKRLLPNPENLRARLERTGYNISLSIYLMSSVLVGLVAFLGGWMIPIFPTAAVALFAVFIAVGVPHLVIGFLGRRRLKKFLDGFPEAIDLIVRGVRSGLPVTECLKAVASESVGPIAVEFALIADAIKFGKSLNEALDACSNRLDLAEFRFFMIALSIQQETGGNLAETLANLSDVLRRRRQMRLKIKAFSSEAKASAYIIGSLPFLMEGLIMSVNSSYAIQLFTDDRGLVMVAAGMMSFLMGIVVMAKMVRFEV